MCCYKFRFLTECTTLCASQTDRHISIEERKARDDKEIAWFWFWCNDQIWCTAVEMSSFLYHSNG